MITPLRHPERSPVILRCFPRHPERKRRIPIITTRSFGSSSLRSESPQDDRACPGLRSGGGFSLVQVMIAMVILSAIVYSTVSIVGRNQRLSEVLTEELSLFHEIRAAMTMIEQDISQAFVLQPRFDFRNRQEIFDAVFVGESQKMSFTTMNYQKRIARARDTNMREVEYMVVPDPNASETEPVVVLKKRSSSFLDEPLFGEGPESAVLSDLKSLQFTYFDEKQKRWVDTWDSRSDETKNIIPTAIAVKFDIYHRDPEQGEKAPTVLSFETKFLADAFVETSRRFELSSSTKTIMQLLGGQQSKGASGQSPSPIPPLPLQNGGGL